MDFMVSKAQRYVNSPEGNDTQTMTNGNGVVSSQLQIAGSSPEGLDKQAVLRRIPPDKLKKSGWKWVMLSPAPELKPNHHASQ
ncbi:hypothetical protein GOBAR_DD12517 [Gossypium barbadense]|nr:hypothetical protein GOBAR_DD12517 [Gossypium barbadense]